MTTYTQTGRPLRVASPLGEDVLLLAGLDGEEGVSVPYRFALTLLSTDGAIDAGELLGQPLRVELDLPSGETRLLHGLVSRLRREGGGSAELHRYQVELVPWLWMLGLSSDCRIFQNLSVPEIVEQVFGDLGHADFQSKLVRAYPPREFCVQYRESHLAFVSRLLEEEGIFYFFRHEADRHVLVLADSPAATVPCPGLRPLRVDADGAAWWGEQDVLTALSVERAVHTAKVTLTDYNYLTPSTSLEASVEGDAPGPEAFDFPGAYADLRDGDRYARLRLEAHEAMREVATATSRCPALASGHVAEVRESAHTGTAGDGSRRWLVLRTAHRAVQQGYLGEAEAAFDYTNDCTLIPADAPYHPPRRTPAPRAYGTQSAVVTGPPGAEIHTDAHGRVKLHFVWDRHGKQDDTSSCWVRVSTAWAGKGWGQFSIPRIGQEVLVEFIEGDPDRPVVVGRVFNAEQPPPCNPAGGGVVSGMRSKTHRGSGYNAMELDDTAGKEQITIHAQYDLDTTVLHDERVSVGNDRTEQVGKNESITIASNRTEQVGADESVDIGGNRLLSVGADSTVTVGANQTVSVAASSAETVGASKTVTVGASQMVQVAASHTELVGISRSASVGLVDNINAGLIQNINAGLIVSINGGVSVVLKAPGGTITIDSSGIEIVGKKVKIQGGRVDINP